MSFVPTSPKSTAWPLEGLGRGLGQLRSLACSLDGEALASLAPPPLDHELARARAHALAETMGSLSPLVVRLIRAFHDLDPSLGARVLPRPGVEREVDCLATFAARVKHDTRRFNARAPRRKDARSNVG